MCQHFVSFRGDTYAAMAGKLCRECTNLSIDCSDEPESFNTGLAACRMQKEKKNTPDEVPPSPQMECQRSRLFEL